MPNKNEVMKALKEKCNHIKETYKISGEIDQEKMSYIEFFSIFYNAAYEEIDKIPEERFDEYSERKWTGRIDTINSFYEKVISDQNEKQPFDFSPYAYADVFERFALNWNNSDYRKYYSPYKAIDQETREIPMVFGQNHTIYELREARKKIENITQFSLSNPMFENNYTNLQLKEMAETLKTNFTAGANDVREGGTPFFTCALLAKGHSIEDIVSNYVPKKEYDDIYQNIMDMKDPKKHDAAMKWAYESFAKGMYVVNTEYDKRINDKALKSPGTWLNTANALLSSTLIIGSSNFYQGNKDDSFEKGIREASKNMQLEYKGLEFDAFRACLSHGGMAEKYNIGKLAKFLDVVTLKDNGAFVNRMGAVFAFYVGANIEVKNGHGYFAMTTPAVIDLPDARLEKWFNDHKDSYGIDSFISDCCLNGKYFNDMCVGEGEEEYIVNIDVDKLNKDYEKYVKEHKYDIAKNEISSAIFDDKEKNTVSQATLNEAEKVNEELTENKLLLNGIIAEQLDSLQTKAKEFDSKFSNREIVIDEDSYNKVKALYEKINDVKAAKYSSDSIYKMATEITADDLNFIPSEKKESVDKEKREEFHSMLFSISNFAEKRKGLLDTKTDTMFNRDYQNNYSKFKEEYLSSGKDANEKINVSEEKIKEAFSKSLYENIDKLENNPSYVKVMEANTLPNSTKFIVNKYTEYMEALKETSKKNEKGEMVGNTQLFTDMYESVKKIAEYKGDKVTSIDKGLAQLLSDAQGKIDKYVEERDSFIKFTSKGRVRLDMAKEMSEVTRAMYDEYGQLSEGIRRNHQKNVHSLSVKAEDIRENTFSKAYDKQTEKVKSPEKTNDLFMGKK